MTNDFYISMLENAIKEIKKDPSNADKILNELGQMLLARKGKQKLIWNIVPNLDSDSYTIYSENYDEIKIT